LPRVLPAGSAEAEAWRPPAVDSYPAIPAAAAESAADGEPDTAAQDAARATLQVQAAELAARQIMEDARARGLEEGRRAVESERQAVAQRIQALEQEIQAERQDFFRRMEPEVVRLAVSIAEKIVGREVEQHPEIVLDAIKRSMKRMQEKEFLRIRVNPDSLELVREHRDDLVAAVDGVQKLEVVDDRRVDPGGCVIESRNGNIDARVGTQVREIERAISGVLEHAEPEPQTGPVEVPVDSQPDGSG
jgi:flagellar assembly protein FliH